MLTVPQVTKRLGQSERTIRNWAAQHRFVGAERHDTPRGPYWMIPEDALAAVERPKTGRPVKSHAKTKPKTSAVKKGKAPTQGRGGRK
jgi:hypothetical protein